MGETGAMKAARLHIRFAGDGKEQRNEACLKRSNYIILCLFLDSFHFVLWLADINAPEGQITMARVFLQPFLKRLVRSPRIDLKIYSFLAVLHLSGLSHFIHQQFSTGRNLII